MRRYDAVDINVYEANLFHTKMLIKEIDLQNYLFNTDAYELPPRNCVWRSCNNLRREMIEIFSGRNIYYSREAAADGACARQSQRAPHLWRRWQHAFGADAGWSPLTCPGISGAGATRSLVSFWGEQCVGMDVNSMKPLDNLCHPVSVIREAEELAAQAFGAAHAFLMVGGTTCGGAEP